MLDMDAVKIKGNFKWEYLFLRILEIQEKLYFNRHETERIS